MPASPDAPWQQHRANSSACLRARDGLQKEGKIRGSLMSSLPPSLPPSPSLPPQLTCFLAVFLCALSSLTIVRTFSSRSLLSSSSCPGFLSWSPCSICLLIISIRAAASLQPSRGVSVTVTGSGTHDFLRFVFAEPPFSFCSASLCLLAALPMLSNLGLWCDAQPQLLFCSRTSNVWT
jgi:hypothetical protein